jgi:uncharacterized membrane protein
MDSGNSRKIAGAIFVVVLLLVGVLVGTLITGNLSTSQNTKTSASQATVSPLEVISPAPGQAVSQSTEIKAMLATTAEIGSLMAVYKIGEETSIPMKITRQGEKVILTGSIDPSQFPKGRQTLSMFLYQTGQLIASSVFYISI